MTLRAENMLVLTGVEATYGVAATLTGADAVQCDFEITPIVATPKERQYTRPYFGARPVIHTEIHRAIKMTNIELAGSGTASVAPAWTSILRGCGWAATTAPTGTTFNPVTDADDSLTIDPSIDGEQFRLIGARGSASFHFEIDEFPKIEAEFKGGWVDPVTLGTVPTPDYTDWKIPHAVNCSNTQAVIINGVSYPFYLIDINQNNEIEFFCVPGESGSRIEIVDREIKGTVKLQAKKISEHNLFSIVKNNQLVPVSMMHGTVAGAKVGFSAPKVQLTNLRKADYKKELAWEVDLLFTPNAGDDEIVFTTP